MSTEMSQDLAEDQAHFDRAWEARETSRYKFAHVAEAAASPGAAVALKKSGDQLADGFGEADSAVAIGRFEKSGDPTYVGRRLILDEEMEPLVISWASPEAVPFYKATVNDHMGVARKRSFRTERNRILSFEETVFEDLSRRVEQLVNDSVPGISDVLLEDLEKNRGQEMRDIVQTIHHSQYEIIERPLNELVIVQGGPGTGKTAVALHRVAWLLFNHSDWLQANDVLVVSPNGAFTQYVKSVLPGLGENNVAHLDLTALGPVASHGRVEEPDTTRLKGEERMATLIKNGLWNRVRIPSTDRLTVDTGRGAFTIDTRELRKAMLRLKASGSPYAAARLEVRQILSESLLGGARRTVDPQAVERELDKMWPSITPARLIQDLLSSRQRLLEAAGDDFTARDIDRLHRPSASRLSTERWADADVALIDEADWLINARSRGFSHIVVDEAQDLSPMQLRSIHRRSANGSYTLVGDLAQSTGHWARDTWDDVCAALIQRSTPQEIVELRYGYRVPREIFALAEPLLALAAPHVIAPQVVRDGPKPPTIALVTPERVVAQTLIEAQHHAARGRMVGVIAPDSLLQQLEDAFNDEEINHRSPGQDRLGSSINLLSPGEVKGLEFDATVVVEPQSIIDENDKGLRLLYISLTRSTRYMSVVHSESVPAIGLDGRPDEDNVLVLRQPPASRELPLERTANQPVQEDDNVISTKRSGVPSPVAAVAAQSAAEIKDLFQPKTYRLYLTALAEELGLTVTIQD